MSVPKEIYDTYGKINNKLLCDQNDVIIPSYTKIIKHIKNVVLSNNKLKYNVVIDETHQPNNVGIANIKITPTNTIKSVHFESYCERYLYRTFS